MPSNTTRRVVSAAVVLLAIAAAPARADKCTGAKLKAVGKKESSLLGCESKVAKTGDSSGLSACEQKVSGKFSVAFGKAGSCAGDQMRCEDIADACESSVAAALIDTFPSKCEAAKRKAAGKLASGELGCYAKAAAKALPVDSTCITKATGKFSAAITKAGACPDGSSPQPLVEDNCVTPTVVTDGGGMVTDVCPTTTTTTTTTTSTTTTTTDPCDACGGCVTVTDCGACGNVCPGYQEPNDNVTCDASQTCTFSCQGENYDVNNDPADGCEVADSPQGNHTSSSPASAGPFSNCDTTSAMLFSGTVPSDHRVHANPAITGFDSISGSAPDWVSITPTTSAFCNNDIVATLNVMGSAFPTCYKLTVIANQGAITYSCQTDGSGSCTISHNSGGQFNDGTSVVFEVSKTCAVTQFESVAYDVVGHF